MSLNGLDSPEVQEAHQVAVAEAGGWFILKYASRDTVELLGRGKGGVSEARNAIAGYTESSPLYGFIIYRRRRVLIKYVPEGTSRVVIARTSVHFQDVLENYAPYETLLEITTPEGLNDTSLAASFPLHTATPSASSGRLDEINEDEDEEEGGPTVRAPTGHPASNNSYFQRQRKARRSEKSPPPINVRRDNAEKATPGSSPAPLNKPRISSFLVREDGKQQSISSITMPPAAPVAESEDQDGDKDAQLTTDGLETPKATTPTTPRFDPAPAAPAEPPSPVKTSEKASEGGGRTTEIPSSTPASEQLSEDRPTTSTTSTTISSMSTASERYKYDDDPYDFSKWDIKPKQKLGPRPVMSGEKTKRPTVASIASVPPTYRPTTKRPEQSRPKSQGPTALNAAAVSKGYPVPPPIPDAPEYNPRPLSRGSIKSLPSHKSTAMTPDKIRLMKAVELRKKQMRKSNPQAGVFVPPPDEDIPAVPTSLEPFKKEETVAEEPEEPAAQPEASLTEQRDLPSNKADSGIEMEYDRSTARDEEKIAEVARPELPEQVAEEPVKPESEPATTFEAPEPEPSKADPHADADGQSVGDKEEPVNSQEQPATEDAPGVDSTHQEQRLTPQISEPQPEPEKVLQPVSVADVELETEGGGPLLPMSRHALPVDPSRQGYDQRSAENSGLNVPAIVMEDGARPLSAIIADARSEDVDVDSTVADSESEAEDKSDFESANSSGMLEQPVRRQTSDIAKRRRGFVEPLQLDGESELTSDDDDDDDFMDELEDVQVQEAKPITVARSPVAHYFPRRPSNNSGASDPDGNSLRTITMGDRASTTPLGYTDSEGRLSPDPIVTDSPGQPMLISTPPIEKIDSMSSTRRNVSTGISKRIQALAEKSSRESNLSGSSPTSRPQSPETLTKDQRQQTRSPPLHSRNSSFRAISRHSSRISTYQSLIGSSSALQQPDSNTTWNVDNDNTGSISVTARIVRPATAENVDSISETGNAFRASKLVVSSHKRGAESTASIPPLQPTEPVAEAEENVPPRSMSPTSVHSSVDGIRHKHSASRSGRDQQASPTVDDFPVPPPSATRPSFPQPPFPTEQSSATTKESTRTSRFFKRMSNIAGGKRRSTLTQSVPGSASPVSERGSLPSSKDRPEMPPSLTVGDLNIQFPDSLLWKRRIVEIDDAGYLTFSIPQAMEHQRGATKKYPLADFRTPYVPDLDRQELPNSIMLDFVDGTTLQIACEDSLTHRQVTQVLKTYWRAWAAISTQLA